MDQLLGFSAFTAWAWVQSLVRELRSYKMHGEVKKKKKKVGSMRHEQDLMMKGMLKVWTLIFRARETWTQPDLALHSVPATRTLRVTDRQSKMDGYGRVRGVDFSAKVVTFFFGLTTRHVKS